ncbi:MAG TPA: ankyrin repeat domain-containing protein [Legionellaceae bacterium]|nr:ankyrin repeat domain-containing protein [Legionellaceae bacterium]
MREIEKLEIYHALTQKKHAKVQEFLTQYPQLPNTTFGPKQRFPLEIAAQCNDTAFLSAFLVNADKTLIWQSMVVAISSGSDEVCDILFAVSSELVKTGCDQSGKHLIHHAAIHGRTEILKKLEDLSCDLHTPIICSHSPDHHKNVLQLAVENNQIECALFLYQSGIKEFSNIDGYYFIHSISEKGYLSLIQAYADDNKNLDESSHNGHTPLAWAACSGQTAVVDYLLTKEVTIDSMITGELSYLGAPIFWAILNGHKDIVQKLLDAGAAINLLCWSDEITETTWWKKPRQIVLSGLFITSALALGGIVSAWMIIPGLFFSYTINNNANYSLLHIAAKAGYADIVALLLQHASDAERWKLQTDAYGKTARDWAENAGHSDIVTLLSDTPTFTAPPISQGVSFYQANSINRRPSFYHRQDLQYTPQETLGEHARRFGASNNPSLIVETHICEKNKFDEPSAMMKLAYPDEYHTFYIQGYLPYQRQSTVRFVRPYFAGEQADAYLQGLNSIQEILSVIQAITKELQRLHQLNIVLNTISLHKIIIQKSSTGYQAIFLDFSKSAEKKPIQSRIVNNNLFATQSTTQDIRIYTKILYEFFYEHPRGFEVMQLMPTLMDFIQDVLGETIEKTTIKSRFNHLFISSDWSSNEFELIELDANHKISS